jgi:aspartate aminotransferase
MKTAARLQDIELSLIRQINALATPLSANLGIGEPNLEPDETLREMAASAARAPWQYSPNAGTAPLRKHLGEVRAPGYDPLTQICVTAGTQEALFAIFQAYVEAGDEVLVPDPGFVAYATLARIAGASAVRYDIEAPDWTLDPQQVISRFTDRTKLVIVNTPSNPLGAVVTRDTLATIASAAAERDILVVSDEVYREIWYDAPPATALGLGRNVIVVDGLSKSHGMTGLRIGWLVADADVMKPILTAHQYIATCASVFSQALAEMIFSDRTWNERWLGKVREQFRMQRDIALEAIHRELGIDIPPPAAAFYAFVPVPSCNTLTFAKSLAVDGAVLVIPGVAFGSQGEGFVRISYAAAPDAITTGIARIGRWLDAQGR